MVGPVYIVCGGTGGHLAPGIATAQRFMESNIPVELIVSEKEVDSRLLAGYPDIRYIRSKGSAFGWHPRKLFPFIYNTIGGAIQSFRLLSNTRPSAIIAFGGFLSVGIVLTARLMKVPVVLHEANRVVGRSIKQLARFADQVFLPEGVHLKGVEPRRLQRIGMPLRREVHHIMKEEIRQRLGIPLHAKALSIVGGSQGALALNEWVKRHRKKLATEGIWINLVTGPGKHDMPELESFESHNGETVQVRTWSFHRSLHELFSASDVVISRAGAGTIAELVACLSPSILIPYPYAADRHQHANALDLERRGGCIVVDQSDMNKLYKEVRDLIYNDWLLAQMRKNLRRLVHEDPAAIIRDHVCRHYIGKDEEPATIAEVAG